MTPRQARAARAMLNLNIKSVCQLANVGIRTLTEFEAGKRTLNQVTETTIIAFYISQGIVFDRTADGDEIVRTRLVLHQSSAAPYPAPKVELFDYLAINKLVDHLNLIADKLDFAAVQINYSSALLIRSMIMLDLNQRELAQKLRCSQNFISLIIAGKKRISPAIAEGLASLNGCPASDLVKFIGAEKSFLKQLRHAVRIISEVRSDANSMLKIQAEI